MRRKKGSIDDYMGHSSATQTTEFEDIVVLDHVEDASFASENVDMIEFESDPIRACPVCGIRVGIKLIESHVSQCLWKQEQK